MDALRSGVLVLDDRVLPLQIGASTVGWCAGIGHPEVGADLRPRRALFQGGDHRLCEEFLAQLAGRRKSVAIVIAVLLLRPVLSVAVCGLIHPGDCSEPRRSNLSTGAGGTVIPARKPTPVATGSGTPVAARTIDGRSGVAVTAVPGAGTWNVP